jgi:hypothetical protein
VMPPMPSMPPESSPGSMGLDDPGRRPGDQWPNEPRDEPDPDWPDDWPDGVIGPPSPPSPSWPGMPPPPARGGGGGIPGRRALALVVVAVVALATGAGVALILNQDPSSVPSSLNSRPPSAEPPSFGGSGSNGNGGGLPGGGGTIEMFAGGKVLAVSGTSITIGGQGHKVTAAVTSSTRVTGRVSSIRSVKVGDLVTAQITQSGGKPTVTAIQDPAQLPSGPSLP